MKYKRMLYALLLLVALAGVIAIVVSISTTERLERPVNVMFDKAELTPAPVPVEIEQLTHVLDTTTMMYLGRNGLYLNNMPSVEPDKDALTRTQEVRTAPANDKTYLVRPLKYKGALAGGTWTGID